jgi:hypothetical protein
MASMRAPQAHWKLWTASHCVASAFPPEFVSMSVSAPGETPAPAGEATRLFPSSLQRDPESWLALAARPVPRPAATLEAELVQLALRPQFDLAARLTLAARPVPQPVALRWVWRSRIPTALSQVYPRVASLQAW